LLDRLLDHTGRRLGDDVALLLFEAAPSSAGVTDGRPGPGRAAKAAGALAGHR